MTLVKQNIKYFSKNALILFILFILGGRFFYKHLLDNGFGFFNLLVNGTRSELISTRSGELMAGDKVFGRFQTPYPNLGIVSVRFDNQYRDSNDVLIFRIKEVDAKKWYYQAEYKTDQFQPQKLFPFGFPPIKDSVNKTYQFELESLRGATGSGIFLNNTTPVFTAVSFFNKQETLHSRSKMTGFVIQKIFNFIRDRENFISVLIYFSPLLFYSLYLLLSSGSFHFLSLITIIAIFCETRYLSYSSDFLILSIIFFWCLVVYHYRFESRISSILALVFFALTILLIVFNRENIAEKTTAWAYLFLCVSVFQQIYEHLNRPTQPLTLEKMRQTLFAVELDTTHVAYRMLRAIFVPLVYLTSFYVLWKIISYIKYSLLLFREFYSPSDYWSSIPYIFYLTVLFVIYILILVYKWRFLSSSPVAILLFLVIVRVCVVTVSAKMTSFQYIPKIFSISPSVTSEAWVDITVTGKNFQDQPFVGKVYLAGIEQGEYLIHWSDEKIIFRTNPMMTSSGDVCVQTLTKGMSNCLPFEYNFGKNTK